MTSHFREKSLLSALEQNWSEQIDLVGIQIQLQAVDNAEILPEYTAWLHAWFLDQVRQYNRALSQYLLNAQLEKPFTLSALEGLDTESGKKLLITKKQIYNWTITALSSKVCQWMKQWLQNCPTSVNLKDISFTVKSVQVIHPPHTYNELLQLPKNKNIALTFLSPTSFSRKGHDFPLPVPINVFESYLRRWNEFSGHPIESEPFLAWIDENILILRHQLTSVKVSTGKKDSVTGFVGAVEYGLTIQGKSNLDYTQLLFALSQLTLYSGTGDKTFLGLGQTRLGWLTDNDILETSTSEMLLAQRIEDLTEIFMKYQKRTGGNRARLTCKTRATILARQELGQSLIEIAEDLTMPYETVKTYAKLARQTLKLSD